MVQPPPRIAKVPPKPAPGPGSTASAAPVDGDIRRARIDHADKSWLCEERRGMQMLTGAICTLVLVVLGGMLGAVHADWLTGMGLVADFVGWARGQ